MFLRKKAYKWHRLLSAIAIIPLTMWAGSAILHQANAWFKPEFVKASYEMPLLGSDTERTNALVAALYQSSAKVLRIKKIEAFNRHYSAKNKVLPVFEASIASEDGTLLYIDLKGQKIVSGSNQASRGIHKWFGYLHKWDFLKPWPRFQIIAIMLFSTITLLAGWLGVYIYFLLPWARREKVITGQAAKLWHRRIGIGVSIFMMLFALTGLMHAVSDVYPALESFTEPLFSQLHLYRFTESLGKQFRFWWLFVVASSFILLVVSGGLLLARVWGKHLNLSFRLK